MTTGWIVSVDFSDSKVDAREDIKRAAKRGIETGASKDMS